MLFISPKKEQQITSSREKSIGVLAEYRTQIAKRLPRLYTLFSSVPDTRKRRDYRMDEILMGGTGMFLFKQGSRNSLNLKRFEPFFLSNYEQTFGLRLPHQDTVADVIESIDPAVLEELKSCLVSGLFDQKWLRPYRLLNQYYTVAVDATGVVSFEKPHCEHCLTKTSKKGHISYFHYVLEAKLVTPDGHAISLASQWIENPSGNFDKQDCEQKAFVRLAAKLKKSYPRLPVCILGDGLYPNNTLFDICQANDWKFILVLQDKTLKSVQDEVDLTRLKSPMAHRYTVKGKTRVNSQYRFHTELTCKKHTLHWMQCVETKTKMPSNKSQPQQTKQPRQAQVQESNFEYVTNIMPTKENVIGITAGGRLRWKVENEGFNTQKTGDYQLEHKYCRKSYNGMKNYYTLLQIAHLINQLVEKSKFVTGILQEHTKQTVRNIWLCVVAYMLMASPIDKPKIHNSG